MHDRYQRLLPSGLDSVPTLRIAMEVREELSPRVSAASIYVPDMAVRTKRREVPVCNGDEDAVTLAIAAAVDCVETRPSADVGRLYVSFGNPPATDSSLGEVIREAVGLPSKVDVIATSGDPVGSVSALFAALDAVEAGRISCALVVASEAGDRRSVGAAAVALIVESTSHGIAVSGLRSAGAVVYNGGRDASGARTSNDLRYVEDAMTSTLVELFGAGGDQSPALSDLISVGGALPASALHLLASNDTEQVGDFGVASSFLALLVGARRAGGADFGTLTTTPSRSVYFAARASGASTAWIPELGLDRPRITDRLEAEMSPILPLPTTSPFFARSAGELLRLEAHKCRNCGHIAFPPSQRPICSECHSSSWSPHRLARRGMVYTFTVNRFLPAGFTSEMVMILGELEDGTRYWAPGSGIAPSDTRIGMPVSLSVRRFTDAGGVPLYAMKFTTPNGATSATVASHAS